MVGAKLGLAQVQGLFVKSERVCITLQKAVAIGQQVHRCEQVGVAGRELRLLKRQGFLAKLDGLGVTVEVGVGVGQSDHSAERFEVFAAQHSLLDGERLFEKRGRLAKSSDVPEILSQAGHGLKCVEVIRTECGLHELGCLHVELEGVIEAVENSVTSGQGELASESIGVLGAERGSAPHEGFFDEAGKPATRRRERRSALARLCMLSRESR